MLDGGTRSRRSTGDASPAHTLAGRAGRLAVSGPRRWVAGPSRSRACGRGVGSARAAGGMAGSRRATRARGSRVAVGGLAAVDGGGMVVGVAQVGREFAFGADTGGADLGEGVA